MKADRLSPLLQSIATPANWPNNHEEAGMKGGCQAIPVNRPLECSGSLFSWHCMIANYCRALLVRRGDSSGCPLHWQQATSPVRDPSIPSFHPIAHICAQAGCSCCLP
jgi:hypothetical protein